MGVAGVAACTAWYIATCTARAYCRLHTTTRQREGAKHLLVEAQPPCAPLCWRRWWRRIWRCCAGTPSPAPGRTLAQLLLAPIPWVQAHVPRRSPPPGRLGRPHRCARELGRARAAGEGGQVQRTSCRVWTEILLAHARYLITRQTEPFRCSAGSVPSRSSRTLRVRRRAVLAGGGLGRPGFCITGPAAGCCHQDGSLPE